MINTAVHVTCVGVQEEQAVLERIVTGRRSSVMSRGGLGSGSPSRAPHILVSEVSMNSFPEGGPRRPGYPSSTANEDSRRSSTHSVGPVFMHVRHSLMLHMLLIIMHLIKNNNIFS